MIGAGRTGEEGLGLYRYLEPDILILDVIMPDMDGIEILRRICWEYPDAQVVICSSINEPHLIDLARMTGAGGYVTKPVNKEAILKSLQVFGDNNVPERVEQVIKKIKSEI